MVQYERGTDGREDGGGPASDLRCAKHRSALPGRGRTG